MGLSVRDRAIAVSTFRWINVRLMEMLAAWVPTTPELEVKLVLGAHIWDVAQHADALGKRTAELRMPEQYSTEPSAAYISLLDELAVAAPTASRVTGFYDVILPGLRRRFTDYIASVDVLLDAPTVRILERSIIDLDRMVAESHELRSEVPAAGAPDQTWIRSLRQKEEQVVDLTVPDTTPADVTTTA
jgi:hypothetical protein